MGLSKPTAVIFDIDGTLANNRHRQDLVTGAKKNFDIFHSLMHLDTIYRSTVDLCHMCRAAGHRIILLTGRPAEYEETTRKWLNHYTIPFDYIFMASNTINAAEYKEQVYYRFIEPRFTVIFAVDDRTKIVEMWRRNGVFCLDVAGNQF